MKVEARVTRKTRDLVLDSAEELLRREVPEVARVRRAEVWSFDVEDAAAAADVRRVLEETTLVVNPNVHRWTLDEGDERTEGARLTVRVTERVDAKEAAVLRGMRRCGAQGVRRAQRTVVWSLDLADTAAGSASRIGEEVAAILGNRHSQEVETRVSEGGKR
ncbi:MAG: hypothetical protein ACRDGR_04850 [bacterium]